MTLKIGNVTLPTTATVNYNGQNVSVIKYGNTVVWQKDNSLSTELELAKTPILMHFDNSSYTPLNSGNIPQADLATYNFSNSTGAYPDPKFSSYYTCTWQQGNAGYSIIGGMTITSNDKLSVECWVRPSANGYYGNNCQDHYAGIVFATSNGDTSGAATVNAIWRMNMKLVDYTHGTFEIRDDNSVGYVSTAGAITSADGWYHMAATHKGNNSWDFFCNGVKMCTLTYSAASSGFNFLLLGHGPTSRSDIAEFDEFVVHSYDRYKSRFAVPTQPYTVTAN